MLIPGRIWINIVFCLLYCTIRTSSYYILDYNTQLHCSGACDWFFYPSSSLLMLEPWFIVALFAFVDCVCSVLMLLYELPIMFNAMFVQYCARGHALRSTTTFEYIWSCRDFCQTRFRQKTEIAFYRLLFSRKKDCVQHARFSLRTSKHKESIIKERIWNYSSSARKMED